MKLSEYLTQSGLSQSCLADKLGISRSRMNLYVKGRREPRARLVAAIEDATHGAVRAVDLITDEDGCEYGL